ncbi:MAG: UPF0182 family protein [Actinomycetota bacterium]
MTGVAVPGTGVALGAAPAAQFPSVALPRVPEATAIWTRALALAWVTLAVYSLHLLSGLLLDFWFFESLGFESVFWTNFRMGTILFVVTFAGIVATTALSTYIHGLSSGSRTRFLQFAVMAGILAGYLAASNYSVFLQPGAAVSFGEADPVFGHDLSFYLFVLPAIEVALWGLLLVLFFALVISMASAFAAPRTGNRPGSMRKTFYVIGLVCTPLTRMLLFLVVLVIAVRIWLLRYQVLTAEHEDFAILNGADYLDVTGFFSTINGYTVSALAVFFMSALALRLGVFHRAATRSDIHLARRLSIGMLAIALLPGITVDVGFKAMTALRDQLKVTPNEPVIQLPYLKRHIDATNKGFGLDDAEIIPFTPNSNDDPLPDIDRILSSPTIRNAPLWPGYVSHLEEMLDLQHRERLALTGGDTLIYGPTLDVFRQQEKLRPYYDFLSIDTVRYNVGGEDRLFASATRELPVTWDMAGPWLLWWGQRQLLFTHGHGLVIAPLNEQTEVGGNTFVSRSIPTQTTYPELQVDQPAIYYGEGGREFAFSNVNGIEEFDFPTDQGRATVEFPQDVKAGVYMDSLLKRLVFGWRGHLSMDLLFSELIKPSSRVHFYRTPLERVERLAPFLYFDTNPYAVAADGKIQWMLNGMTYTDRYPYSWIRDLGDKADVRTPTPRPTRLANYVRDSVKATIDAHTGKVTIYKWADEPVVNTWAGIYPDLFTSRDAMSEQTRNHVYYPVQLFHTQFDDVNVFYHMRDPVEFFNREDLWDDADEVKGGLISEGESMNFSIEPYFWMAEPGKALPAAGKPTQFAMSKVYTPEAAVNLRSIVTVYMDGEDYGKISVLQIPKGQFFQSPEQADAAIDQDALISSQITLWNRLGTEVIRGHTSALVIDNELIYIEPMFIKSKQNPAPQMKRVIVVFRGQAFMGATLEDALRSAILGVPEAGLEGAGGTSSQLEPPTVAATLTQDGS